MVDSSFTHPSLNKGKPQDEGAHLWRPCFSSCVNLCFFFKTSYNSHFFCNQINISGHSQSIIWLLKCHFLYGLAWLPEFPMGYKMWYQKIFNHHLVSCHNPYTIEKIILSVTSSHCLFTILKEKIQIKYLWLSIIKIGRVNDLLVQIIKINHLEIKMMANVSSRTMMDERYLSSTKYLDKR